MAAREKRAAAKEEPAEPSRAAGGCVLVVLGCAPLGVAFAVSPAVGVLAVWAVGVVLLGWFASRPVSDSSATPPPPSGTTLYAAQGTEIERVQEGPGEGLTILYPVRKEVNDQ